ncbi:MAG: phosphatidate cytidylyltransferase [Treponema sp.]|nr:phosphatidate cytidylyltransferase [Treponema sp.]
MSKLAQRLLTFFIGVPICLLFVYFNFLYHLPLNVIIITITFFGANEFYNLSLRKTKMFARPLLIIFSGLLPLASYLFKLFGIDTNLVLWILTFEIIILLSIETFTAKTFEDSLPKIGYSILLLFYTGYMPTFISKISFIENYSRHYFILFLLFVFLCDSAAWLFGLLFGKNNRGLIKASPNKSIAGFIGGIAATLALGALAKLFFPDVFFGGIWKILILAFVTAIAGIIGDLVESVFKRSSDIKDSGKIIPGRGGILDSVDSILIAAPIFYMGCYILYNV